MKVGLFLFQLPLLLFLWNAPQASAQEHECRAFKEPGQCFDSNTPMTKAMADGIGDAIAASGDLPESVYEQ